MQSGRWMARLAAVALLTLRAGVAVAAQAQANGRSQSGAGGGSWEADGRVDDNNGTRGAERAWPRGWGEEDWLLRGALAAPLCPDGCACEAGTLRCADPPPGATHLVVHNVSLAGALSDEHVYEHTEHKGPFGAVRGLRRVALRGCELRAVRPWAMAPLRSLREVDLTGNQLRSLAPRTFAACDDLAKLFLSGNPLVTPPALSRDSLLWVQMDDCDLQEIPEDTFKGTPQVVYLTLKRNALRALSAGALRPLQRLCHLHVEDNGLGRLDPGLIAPLRLMQALHLRRNPLQLPADEPMLESESLLILDVRECGIRNISVKTFSMLPSLRSLLMAGNQIDTLPAGVFDKLHHLITLDISHNKITELDPVVFKVLRFKVNALLDVTGNPLGCSCLVLKCQQTPRRCALANAGLVWREGEGEGGGGGDAACTEEERAACLVGGVGGGGRNDSDLFDDPPADIESMLRPKEPSEDGSLGRDSEGDNFLSVSDRRTQMAIGISGAVVFVIVIAVTVYMARRCRKDELERRGSSSGEPEEAALSWTLMDPETMRVPSASSDGKKRRSSAATSSASHRASAGGVGDKWRRPRSQACLPGSLPPALILDGDDPLPPYEPPASAARGRPASHHASFGDTSSRAHGPYAALSDLVEGGTGTFRRQRANATSGQFPPVIQHHRNFADD